MGEADLAPDGKLRADLDVLHLARGAQSLLEAGTRHWAGGEYGDNSFAAVIGRDITAFILGHSQLDTRVREPIGLDPA